MEALRGEIRRRVQDKHSTTRRVEADVVAAAARLEAADGSAPARELELPRVRDLEDAVADAAGISAVVEGIERTVGARARRAVAWPPFALLRRRDPDLEGIDDEPRVAPVDRSTVDTAVRGLADELTDSMAPGWAAQARAAATARLPELDHRLERELREVDLGGRLPFWVQLVRLLHGLLLLASVGGLAWWGLAAVRGDVVDLPEAAGLPLPPMVGVAGLALGLLLGVVGRALVGGLARRRAEAADDRLRGVVQRVLEAEVVKPLGAELGAYAEFRRGIATAQT